MIDPSVSGVSTGPGVDQEAAAGRVHAEEDLGFEIWRQHAAMHAGPYKDSILRAELVAARESVPGVIVAHARTELDGDDRAPGQTRRSFATFVIERRAGPWRFTAAHNTNVPPPPG